MLAAVTRSPGELVVEDVGGPWRARPGHVIVRPEAVGICGSDFHLFFNVGDLDADCASFVEPASVAVHAVVRGRLKAGEQILVFGAGPIGLAVLAAARREKARVMSVDPVKARRDLAGHLGAEAVTWAGEPEDLIAQARDWTRGEGPPLVIETSGATSVLETATEIVAPAGRVVVVGMSSKTAPVRPGIFPEKEIDVLGSSTATAADFRDAISLVSKARDKISQLFSHHFPLARAAEAFEFAMSRPPDAVKIVVNVN